jgi:thiol-disulfide isomerase/thioredoxin
VKDSTVLKNGKAVFKGKIQEAVFAFVSMKGNRGSVAFFLENSPATITSNGSDLSNAAVKAGKEQEAYAGWVKDWKSITSRAGVLYQLLDSASQKNKVPVDSITRKYVDDGFVTLTLRTDTAVGKLVKANPDAVVSAWVIEDRYINYLDMERAQKYYGLLSKKGKATASGKAIESFFGIQARSGIGARPELTMEDSTGKMVTLASFKGKYVLVDFWASWCGPCRKENPTVKKAYDEYHQKGFEVVGASLDVKKDLWLKAVEKDGLGWTQLSDLKGWESPAVKYFGIKGIPFNFLVDREGKVVAKNLRGEALLAALQKYMN